MEIIGELNNTDLTIEIDTDDVLRELGIDDRIEDGCRDYLDNYDFDEHVNIDAKAEDLLLQYDGMNDPCGLGQAFEKAVWWAMSRYPVRTPLFSEDGVRKIVREELRSILGKTIDAYLGKDEDASTT